MHVMIPGLYKLSISDDAGKKRRRTDRDESFTVPTVPTDGALSYKVWKLDVENWKYVVCSVWDGVPRGVADVSWGKPMSPSGDWEKRMFVEKAELSPGLFYGTSCTVVRNVYNFEPNGRHHMDMELVKYKLSHHYNTDDYSAPFDLLPAGTATTHDIKAWVAQLEPPPWTAASGFDLWKRQVFVLKFANGAGASTVEGVGMITYEDGQTYIGETILSDGESVPNGMGFIRFADGATWRGRWEMGKRTLDFGVFTDSDGTVTLGRWSDKSPIFKSTTRLAVEELKHWKETYTFRWEDEFLVEKPGYGRIAVASGRVGGVLRMANWHTETAIARMMTTTNCFHLGQGRDVIRYVDMPNVYTKLLPIAVFDVDYTNSSVLYKWEQYQRDLVSKLAAGPNITSDFEGVTRMDRAFPALGYHRDDGVKVDSNLASLGVPLRYDVNEKFLLHTTKAEDLFAILNTSFDISYSRRGLFGSGIYFTDDPGKSDQYAKPVPISSPICKRLGLDREHILDILKKNAVISKKKADRLAAGVISPRDYDVFFVLVSRVPLGLVASPATLEDFQKNKLPKSDKRRSKLFPGADDDMGSARNLKEPYSSLTMKDLSREEALRYREYVVYENAVARPSHLIAYCRARSTQLTYDPSRGARREYFWTEAQMDALTQEDGTMPVDKTTAYRDPFG